MKKNTCLFIITICFFVTTIMEVSAEDVKSKIPEINMEFFNIPPHVFLDKKTGSVTGAVVEFINDHMAPGMGVKFIWNKASSNIPRQLHTLETQPGYAAALIVYTSKRSEVSDFTKVPYFMSQSALIVRKDNPLEKIAGVDEILHMKIGYAGATFITPFMEDKRIKWDFISDSNFTELNIKKLLADRIDASYAPDATSLLYAIQKLNYSEKIKVLELPEPPAPFHIVFSKGSDQTVEKYNQVFDKLNGQTLYLKLLSKYTGVAQ